MSEHPHVFAPLTARIGRRTFLQAGALALGGWSLADQFRLEAATGTKLPEGTAVIQIFCGGGPSQLDMYDMKPDAPKEIRGEFSPISTAIPGYHICEYLPRQAAIFDKLAVVRSVQHTNPSHLPASHWAMTGYQAAVSGPENRHPAIGAVVSKVRGPNVPGMPAYVGIPRRQAIGASAYLGQEHNPFTTDSDPSKSDFEVKNLVLANGLTGPRLDVRSQLRAGLDRLGRSIQKQDAFTGMDRFSEAAYELVTSEHAAQAFNLAEEDPRLREKYGNHTGGQACLLARRLVEAGVTFLSLVSGADWDTHTDNFERLRTNSLPKMDSAVPALVEDLHDRGLADRVMLIVHGEFGRTPKVNKDGGRDHWPGAACVLFAGGGIRGGQVIGETDRHAAYPITKPHTPGDVLATVYNFLGINCRQTFTDQSARVFPVLPEGAPIRELYS